MPAIPWLIAAAIGGAFLGGQLDDALESLDPFAGDGKAINGARLAVIGLAGFGAITLWRRFT